VPVEDSLLYVQPLYIQSEQTKLPQFKRVIVFYRAPAGAALPPSGQQQNVIMAPSLDEALAEIFGSAKTAPAPSVAGAAGASSSGSKNVPGQVKALITQANEQYNAAEDALKAGDFAGYGRGIKELEASLRKLQALP
jgi:uncharacterized membrane protein (UPF0182 family)